MYFNILQKSLKIFLCFKILKTDKKLTKENLNTFNTNLWLANFLEINIMERWDIFTQTKPNLTKPIQPN